jgi:hypothetical protein
VRELDASERRALEARPEFSQFLERTARVVERALAVDYDILVDYTLYRADDGYGAHGCCCCACISSYTGCVLRFGVVAAYYILRTAR